MRAISEMLQFCKYQLIEFYFYISIAHRIHFECRNLLYALTKWTMHWIDIKSGPPSTFFFLLSIWARTQRKTREINEMLKSQLQNSIFVRFRCCNFKPKYTLISILMAFTWLVVLFFFFITCGGGEPVTAHFNDICGPGCTFCSMNV